MCCYVIFFFTLHMKFVVGFGVRFIKFVASVCASSGRIFGWACAFAWSATCMVLGMAFVAHGVLVRCELG